jgi:hypothetical protein
MEEIAVALWIFVSDFSTTRCRYFQGFKTGTTVIIDKEKEKKWTEVPKTNLIDFFTTERVSKIHNTVEKEDSGFQRSESCLDRNQI